MKTRIRIMMDVESGCDPSKGEYTLFLQGFCGSIKLDDRHSDIELAKDCIANDFPFSALPDECFVDIDLIEDGEREDVFYNKYYRIDSYSINEKP